MFEGHDSHCEENTRCNLFWGVQNNVPVSYFLFFLVLFYCLLLSNSILFFFSCTIDIRSDVKQYSGELSQTQASHCWFFAFQNFTIYTVSESSFFCVFHYNLCCVFDLFLMWHIIPLVKWFKLQYCVNEADY